MTTPIPDSRIAEIRKRGIACGRFVLLHRNDERDLFFELDRLVEENGKLTDALKQCATELQEAANIMRPTYPAMASIYVAAAIRALKAG